VAHRRLAIIRRSLFTFFSLLSLLLCLAVLTDWLTQSWQRNTYGWLFDSRSTSRKPGTVRDVYILGSDGKLSAFVESHLSYYGGRGATGPYYSSAPRAQFLPTGSWLQRRGFGFAPATQPWDPDLVVSLPNWFLAAMLAILPSLQIRAALRLRHRRREGLCLQCGYDLRASPDRCPECGAEPKTS
jgi:hypothetical protein